jgi:hypothetical protein
MISDMSTSLLVLWHDVCIHQNLQQAAATAALLLAYHSTTHNLAAAAAAHHVVVTVWCQMLDCCMVLCDRQVADLQCDVQSLELKRDSLLQELRSAQEKLRQLHTDNGTMLREQRTAKVTLQCYTTIHNSMPSVLQCR